MSERKLIIVDISNFIFRAFYAIRPLTAPDGTPTNAVHGVWSMLYKLIVDHHPTHLFMARDTRGGSFRNEMYDLYKANRSAPPDELIPQFPLIEELVNKMGFNSLALERYEADDIIGSACIQWKDSFDEILVASGDKDLMQFVAGNIKILDTMKGVTYDRDGVFEKMGVWPEQIVDYLSILGDASDNIPGMKGIGAKGAAKLLAEFGTLEACFENTDKMKGKRLIDAFANYKDKAILSKSLVEIVTDINLDRVPEDTLYTFNPGLELKDFFRKYGLKAALKKVEEEEFSHALVEQGSGGENNFKILHNTECNLQFTKTIIDTTDEALKLFKNANIIALHSHFDSDDIIARKLLAISLTIDGKEAYYLNAECDFKIILKQLWGVIGRKIISDDVKREYHYLLINNIPILSKGMDVIQAHFDMDPGGRHDLAFLAVHYLDFTMSELAKGESLADLAQEQVAEFCAEKAIATWALWEKFAVELKVLKVDSVFDEIDNPLLEILAEMEVTGIILNAKYLEKLEGELAEEVAKINTAIRAEISEHIKVDDLPEEEINLKSPKQVGHLLFELLNLPVIKKTKTGISTDSEVLAELDSRNLSKVPGLILKLRELEKILSTYVRALPQMINPATSRVHTHFNQREARTGRLSSVNPNLQNIPIRSESGRKIRKAFIAKPGTLLLAADYSQVELRLLAHFSGDETMIKAFNDGVDIHSQTASEVLMMPLEQVKPNDRSIAKAVNFGLMYGQSSFGLSKTLRISRGEAKDYITKYFRRFSKVKAYLDSLKEFAEAHGYSKTLFGRKRFLPDIKSTNRNIKSQAERIAVNSPIQGTAADIIKMAMINLNQSIKEQNLKSKLILQVHDELIFEVPEEELDTMRELVRIKMENVVDISIPLKVDMGIGVNWFDLK